MASLPAPQISVSFTEGSAVAPHGAAADALVVGCWKGRTLAAGAHRHGLSPWLDQVVRAHPAFTGKIGQALALHNPGGVPTGRVVLAGLGSAKKLDTAGCRRLGAEAGAALATLEAETAAVSLDLDAAQAAAFALGLSLRLHRTPQYRGRPDPDAPKQLRAVTLHVTDTATAEAAWAVERARASGVTWARDLMTEPAGHLTPNLFADRLSALETVGITVEILDASALAAQGLALHLAVGQASANPPCLAVLRWRGGSSDTPPTLLVGKGITFDTGGLCLKPPPGMEEMKGDMGGAATVAGTLRALAEAKAPVNVTGVVALAENMADGNSYRPGDVLRSHKGLTVEVVDTDAEGRMVLADALSWGCATEQPARVIDLATLTGSIVTALGLHTAGLFCRDDSLADAVAAAGRRCDEAFWRMPLTDWFDDLLDSPIADLRQCAPAAPLLSDALHAARFLSHFVPDDVPHAHLDIAGVAETETAGDHRAAGPVGFGVLTLTALLHNGA